VSATVDIRPDLDRARLEPLRHVIRQAGLQAPSPPWVVVEDAAGAWLHHLTTATASERASGVAVVRSEKALLQCVRLAIGGALWEPPSSAGMTLAFIAADERPSMPAVCDLCVTTALVAHQPPRFVVRWSNQALWHHQIGAPRMAVVLWRLAKALGAVPAVIPGPCLLLPEVSSGAVDTALAELERGGEVVPADGLEVLTLPVAATAEDTVAAAVSMVSATAQTRACRPMEPRPVYELPSGRHLGWWSSEPTTLRPATGWIALPELDAELGIGWRLVTADGEVGRVHDAVGSDRMSSPLPYAVRLRGWTTMRSRPGSPCGLLAEHMVGAARRLGRPVWIPNVDQDAVQLALRLGGPVWVDGPAVPPRPFEPVAGGS
jgi:hypothetical protein